MGENRLNDIKKQKRNIRIFSSNALKIIACVSMLIDHIGIVFVDNNLFMRAVGRLAFPVFAFLLVQGLLRTSDVRRYLLRLGIFAVVSEIPFDLAMHDTMSALFVILPVRRFRSCLNDHIHGTIAYTVYRRLHLMPVKKSK